MSVVDILVSIVVVTILVTIILAVVTYVAYKLRLAREPERVDTEPGGLRYFVRFEPPVLAAEAKSASSQAGTRSDAPQA